MTLHGLAWILMAVFAKAMLTKATSRVQEDMKTCRLGTQPSLGRPLYTSHSLESVSKGN